MYIENIIITSEIEAQKRRDLENIYIYNWGISTHGII